MLVFGGKGEREEAIGFNALMLKLEKRFGGVQLPDTAQE